MPLVRPKAICDGLICVDDEYEVEEEEEEFIFRTKTKYKNE